jgi:hypothetical protein
MIKWKTGFREDDEVHLTTRSQFQKKIESYKKFDVVFNKREVVFYQSTKGRGRSPRPFVL